MTAYFLNTRFVNTHTVAKVLLSIFALGLSTAYANDQKIDLSLIEVTPHELALTEVLAEICPAMLTHEQQKQFTQAYQMQLTTFMPSLDTKIAMQQMHTQKEYQSILNSIRTWTLSYPKDENKALCIEFAEAPFKQNAGFVF